MPKLTQFFVQHRWPWLAVSLALTSVLFISSALGWYWYADHRSNEDRQLAVDFTWLEQNIDGTLNGDKKILNNWANDLVRRDTKTKISKEAVNEFVARINGLAKTNPALLGIEYLDENRTRLAGFPHYEERPAHLPPVNDPYINDAINSSLISGQSTYSQVIEQFAPLWVLVVPITLDNENYGFIIATYDLDQLLANKVPWWFIKRYEVRLIGKDDKQLSPRDMAESTTEKDKNSVSTLNFGPHNAGLSLQASRHQRDLSKILLASLALAVILLGTLVIYLMRVLQRWLLERQLVRQALANELRFREAMERSLVTGLLAFDRDARIIYVNPALCDLVGRTTAELIHSDAPYIFWPTENSELCEEMHLAMLNNALPSTGCNLEFMHASGKLISVRLFASSLVDEKGLNNGWMVSLYDTTQERQSVHIARERDELLQQTSRLATLAEFASGISHELNQPLAAIANYSAAAESFLDNGDLQKDRLKEAVRRIGEESRRAGKIIHSMRNFIQRREVRHARHNLCDLIKQPLVLLEPHLERAHVKISVMQERDCFFIDCDAVMIEQVVFNLLRNSIEAIEAIEATEQKAQIGDTAIKTHLGLVAQIVLEIRENANYVEVRISDTGIGITDHDALFHTFYTTKSGGMGLGLAICRTVIESHGGRLWAEDRNGGGACFSFRIPISVLI